MDGRLAGVPEEAGVQAVAAVLVDVRPDLVVTFGPDGLTGHSDHRTVSLWVSGARERVGSRAVLWYAALTAEFLDRWGAVCTEQGVWMDGGPPEPVDPADVVHVQTCSGALLDRKYASLAAHTSQTAELIERGGGAAVPAVVSMEAFAAAPPVDDDAEWQEAA